MLASSQGHDHFDPLLSQTKDYKIVIFCPSPKHAALWNKSEDWLAWSQDNSSKWINRSVCGLLFQLVSTIKKPIQFVSLVQKRRYFLTNETAQWMR